MMSLIKLFKKILLRLKLLQKTRNHLWYKNLAVRFNPGLKHAVESEIKFYTEFLKKESLSFDIGANIGAKTYIFHKLGARVVAAEPDPDAFQVLLSFFKRKNRVVLVNKGLDSKEETRILYKSDHSTMSTFSEADRTDLSLDKRFNKLISYKNSISMQVTTLDKLIETYGTPEYCKISTVGYEINVIKGLSKKLKAISFTCNKPYQIENTILCIEHLSQLGVYLYNYTGPVVSEGFLIKWVNAENMINQLREMKKDTQTAHIDIYAKLILN